MFKRKDLHLCHIRNNYTAIVLEKRNTSLLCAPKWDHLLTLLKLVSKPPLNGPDGRTPMRSPAPGQICYVWFSGQPRAIPKALPGSAHRVLSTPDFLSKQWAAVSKGGRSGGLSCWLAVLICACAFLAQAYSSEASFSGSFTEIFFRHLSWNILTWGRGGRVSQKYFPLLWIGTQHFPHS